MNHLEKDCLDFAIILKCKVADEYDIEALCGNLSRLPGTATECKASSSNSLDIIWKTPGTRSNFVRVFLDSVLNEIQTIYELRADTRATPLHLSYVITGDDIASADVHISSSSSAILRRLNLDVSIRIKTSRDAPDGILTPASGSWFDAFLDIYSDVLPPESVSALLNLEPCRTMTKAASSKMKNPISTYGCFYNIESKRHLPDVLISKILKVFSSRSEKIRGLQHSCRVRLGAALFLKPDRHNSAAITLSRELFKEMTDTGVNDGLMVNFYFM